MPRSPQLATVTTLRGRTGNWLEFWCPYIFMYVCKHTHVCVFFYLLYIFSLIRSNFFDIECSINSMYELLKDRKSVV